LQDKLKEGATALAVFFLYVGKELPDYTLISGKIELALQKLIRDNVK
jgi:hypothetical protein